MTAPQRFTLIPERRRPDRVWRFALPLVDRTVLQMPQGAHALSVGPPRGEQEYGFPPLDLWALVTADAELTDREFLVVGTGNPIPPDASNYVGTTHSHDGRLIWHVFEGATFRAPGDAA